MLTSATAPALAAWEAGGVPDAGQSDWSAAFSRRLAQIAGNPVRLLEADPVANERQTLDFNTDWLFVRGNVTAASDPDYNDSEAEQISLPHNRRSYDLFAPDIDDIQSIDWYRRHFTLSESDSGSRVLVEFNGGGQINRVYVNGVLVGEAKGTFTHFQFDITDYISFGAYDNVIALQVDSSYHGDMLPPGNSIDFHMFGGLHGRASMTIVDPAHIDSVFYYNDAVTTGTTSATIHGRVEVKNDYQADQSVSVRSVIYDVGGNAVSTVTSDASPVSAGEIGTIRLSHTVNNPHLWNTDDPYLYTVKTEVLAGDVVIDQYENTLGIRTLTVTPYDQAGGYFSLNGEKIYLLGGNRHMQAPYLGNSLPEKLNERDAYVIKYDLGYNIVRTSHYETDPSFLEACDRIGLMVEEEPLGWQDTPDWEQFDYSLYEMIERDRNHASIVMWSIVANERAVNAPTVQATTARSGKVNEMDPSRVTIQEEFTASAMAADVLGWHDYSVAGVNNVSRPSNSAVKSWFITEWNTNLGKYFVIPGDSETRKLHQVVNDGAKLAGLTAHPDVMGNLKWDIFGYTTPMSAYERGKNVALWRSSGVYGVWRDPLHKTWIAYLLAAQSQDTEAVGSVLKICSEWKSDSGPVIYVTTNLDYDDVRLYYVDGDGRREVTAKDKDPGTATLGHGLIRFTLADEQIWAEGTRLVAEGNWDGETVTDTLWASTYESEKDGAALILHNTLDPAVYGDLEADGADVAWILAELVDKNGQREFYGDDNVTVEILGGPGELVYDGYSGTGPRMLDGLSGFYLRSGKDRIGVTTIRASADLGVNYDDGDPMIEYTGNWTVVNNKQDAYQGGCHRAAEAGASAAVTFTGTQIVLYAESAFSGNGRATVTVDGGQSAQADFTNAAKYDTIANQAVYRSPVLPYGEHTLVITANSANAINIDRIKVFDGKADVVSQPLTVATAASPARDIRVPCDPTLPPAETAGDAGTDALSAYIAEAEAIDRTGCTVETLAVLDETLDFAYSVMDMAEPSPSIIKKAVAQLSAAITGLERFLYIIPSSRTSMKDQDDGVYYYSKNMEVWTKDERGTYGTYYANKQRTAGDYAEITFNGVKIELYSNMDAAYGNANIYIDSALKGKVDMYQPSLVEDGKYYTSGKLEPGRHQLKLEVTAEPSENLNNACVGFGYAVVYTKFDQIQELKVHLAELLAREDAREDRASYTTDSLDALDRVVLEAEAVLRNTDATEDDVRRELDSLNAAVEELTRSAGAAGPVTISCRDEDKTTEQETLNKVFYYTAAGEWVFEGGDDEAKANRYLKKVNMTERDYCEITFTGTRIDLYAKLSNTNGRTWIQVDDEQEIEVDLYKETAPQDAVVELFHTVSGLENGRHKVRIIAQNKAHDGTAGDGTAPTSINFAKAVVYTEAAADDTLETEELAAALAQVNARTGDGLHEQLWMSFLQAVTSAARNSNGILTGAFPNIEAVDPLPAGTTQTRIDQVTAALQAAPEILGRELRLASVNTLPGITARYGTAQEALPLPTTVKGVTSDAQSITLTVLEWTPEGGYESNTPGAYTFTATLQAVAGLTIPEGVTASIDVTVGEQTSKFTAIVKNGGSIRTEEYAEGEQVVVTAQTLSDQHFVCWTSEGILLSETQRTSRQFTFTMPANDVTLTAVYEAGAETEPDPPAVYTLTVNGGSGGGEYTEGGTVTVTANAPAQGMRFKEWNAVGVTLDDPAQSAVSFTMPANSVILTAIYEEIPAVNPDPPAPPTSSVPSPQQSTTTVTVKNEDGSTTTTATNNQTGTVTETTTRPNGDKTVVETRKDGTVTETVSRQDGWHSEMVTKPDGSFSCRSTDANGVITESRRTAQGEVTGSVAVPRGVEQARVSIPAQDLGPCTVAVVIHEDGTETVIKTSVLTDEGLNFIANGDVDIRLVDNSKEFADVFPNRWWWDTIRFAASRELFNGTGGEKFSPDGEMTKAMLVTVLARLAGVETDGGDAWYSEALAWGMKTGVTDGTNYMLSVTREQMVTMLYRYAGMPEAKGSLLSFSDQSSVSDWAYDAMSWAVDTGLIYGRGSGVLAPSGTATRAEVAAILQRFISGYFR